MAYQMDPRHKEVLRKNRIYLLKEIVLSDILDCLYGHGVLTEDTKEEIEVEKLKKQKIGALLDLLPRRGPDAFRHFIFALMETGNEHVAMTIDSEYVQEWQKEYGRKKLSPKPCSPAPRNVSRPKVTVPNPSTPPVNPVPATPQNDESPFLMFGITPVDTDDTHMAKLLSNHKDVYRMDRNPRGRAIIINNSYFVNSPKREGAAFDSLNLCEHLKKLYFDTVLFDDATADEMKAIFDKERQDEYHWNADCLVVFVLSHGSQGRVYGIDGQSISIEGDIVTPFDGDHCKALVNKPKLFFIQACQGDSATQGTPHAGDEEVDASPLPDPEEEQEYITEAMQNLQIQDTASSLPTLSRSHEKSDIVIAYSTVPGYRSWRRTDLGSWFVRAIIEVFSKKAHEEDLLSLLVKVRQRVSEHQTNHEDKSFVQLTRTDETTKKKIYFFPGHYTTTKGDSV